MSKKPTPDNGISDAIGLALNQIEQAQRQHANKKKYLVEEVSVEFSLKSEIGADGGLKLALLDFGIKGGANVKDERAHSITIKLKPKSTSP